MIERFEQSERPRAFAATLFTFAALIAHEWFGSICRTSFIITLSHLFRNVESRKLWEFDAIASKMFNDSNRRSERAVNVRHAPRAFPRGCARWFAPTRWDRSVSSHVHRNQLPGPGHDPPKRRARSAQLPAHSHFAILSTPETFERTRIHPNQAS